MFIIETYISDLIAGCRNTFDDRLLYVGLQGSYLRDEATESSDIDIMVVIDGLSVADLGSYRNILKRIGYFDKSCGFICGKNDLLNWNPLEICHLLHTTKDYYGTLSELVPSYTRPVNPCFSSCRIFIIWKAVILCLQRMSCLESCMGIIKRYWKWHCL